MLFSQSRPSHEMGQKPSCPIRKLGLYGRGEWLSRSVVTAVRVQRLADNGLRKLGKADLSRLGYAYLS